MLSESQLKFVADILLTIGEVSLVSLIIPYFISSELNLAIFSSGLVTTAVVWVIGLIIMRDIK